MPWEATRAHLFVSLALDRSDIQVDALPLEQADILAKANTLEPVFQTALDFNAWFFLSHYQSVRPYDRTPKDSTASTLCKSSELFLSRTDFSASGQSARRT